jgi:hypothetical protein
MDRHVVYTAILKANRQANEELFRHQQSVLEKPAQQREERVASAESSSKVSPKVASR